jgi:hypothetical protein
MYRFGRVFGRWRVLIQGWISSTLTEGCGLFFNVCKQMIVKNLKLGYSRIFIRHFKSSNHLYITVRSYSRLLFRQSLNEPQNRPKQIIIHSEIVNLYTTRRMTRGGDFTLTWQRKANNSWTTIKGRAVFYARPKCSRTGDSMHLIPCANVTQATCLLFSSFLFSFYDGPSNLSFPNVQHSVTAASPLPPQPAKARAWSPKKSQSCGLCPYLYEHNQNIISFHNLSDWTKHLLSQTLLHVSVCQRHRQGAHMILTSYLFVDVHTDT